LYLVRIYQALLVQFFLLGSGLKKLTGWVGYWTPHPSALLFTRFPSLDALDTLSATSERLGLV
jgi:hypothetical protein